MDKTMLDDLINKRIDKTMLDDLINTLVEALTIDEDNAEDASKTMGEVYFEWYSDLIKAGFSEAQAFELLKVTIVTLMASWSVADEE